MNQGPLAGSEHPGALRRASLKEVTFGTGGCLCGERPYVPEGGAAGVFGIDAPAVTCVVRQRSFKV